MDTKLMRYVPRRVKPHITDAYRDDDGYWAVCERGWRFANTGCHTAHGNTIAEFKEDILSIYEVNYEDDWD